MMIDSKRFETNLKADLEAAEDDERNAKLEYESRRRITRELRTALDAVQRGEEPESVRRKVVDDLRQPD